MPHPFELERSAPPMIPLCESAHTPAPSIEPLADENEREVLAFLSASSSVQAIFMTGLVRDNGLESPFNRGIFYGARRSSRDKEIAGVALIGHATLVETEDAHALEAFARLARAFPRTHVHLGQEERIRRFWNYYSRGEQRARLVCREMLFRLSKPLETDVRAEGLRLATLDDLPFVMPVQAAMAFEESGVDPMKADAVGFRLRCARRIEQGRVFVWIESGRLLFKADILAETESAAYLEGVYTSPSARNRSHGSRCLMEMSRALLRRTRSIMLLVNEQNRKAQEFYRRAGFEFGGYYDTIFLNTGV